MNLYPATRGACLLLSSTLRACDRQEIALGSGRAPFAVLWDSVQASAIAESIETPEGNLAGIWGVTPTDKPEFGSIWMLGSEHLERIPLSFLRACKPAIGRAHALYPSLVCAPWRENDLHLQWLAWLGFKFYDVGHPTFLPHYRHV